MSINSRKIAFASLMMILAVVWFAGCVSELSEDQIVAKMVDTANKIDTYQYNFDMSTNMKVGTQNGTKEITTKYVGKGEVDTKKKKMKMDMDMTMDMPDIGPQNAKMQMYLIDDMMYMYNEMMPSMGNNKKGNWMKLQMPMESWDKQNQVKQQIELLKASEIKQLKDEVVDGIDCYVFEAKPDPKKLMEIMSQQQGGNTFLENENLNYTDMIKHISVKEWIAKDTLFPKKSDMQMTLTMSSENISTAKDHFEMTMDMSMTTTFNDYNKKVSIELPPEAESAMSLPNMPQHPSR